MNEKKKMNRAYLICYTLEYIVYKAYTLEYIVYKAYTLEYIVYKAYTLPNYGRAGLILLN